MDDATSPTTPSTSERTGLFAAGGSILAALAASACCWIPLLLIAFGVSAGGVGAWFEEYRWYFLALSGILLALAFYFVYFRTPKCAQCSESAAPSRGVNRFNRVMLWMAAFIVIATAAFPEYVGYLIPEDDPEEISIPTSSIATYTIPIEGMTCEACAVTLHNALLGVEGVIDASVDYEAGDAVITFDATSPPSGAGVIEAIEGAGYGADPTSLDFGSTGNPDDGPIQEEPAMLNLVFLTRDGCANTPIMLANLDAAIKSLGRSAKDGYEVVNQDTLPPIDPRVGYPTPTLLMDGKDMFGLPVPTPPFPAPG